ncbi:amidohydrolase family protein [Polaribacter batillariae]|uniref:Amidohydrolase family protein n=1 Tax=Polaribacter batillariae TaxID=2808900 RepID=A0ABX7SYZ1_9FLAO|nr:amidohydrolase family protein [Polaribacter batillariae]QTD38508.1 amidohydrolase family protein [Polaribacter batillariae]
MRIDAHQHFWQFNPQRDMWITDEMAVLQNNFLPKDLEPLLQKHQFNGCVAVQAATSEKETQFLLDLAKKNKFIKGVVGWLDLCNGNIQERLSYFSSYKNLKGLRHIVQAEPNGFMLRKDFQKGISALEKHNLTYDILIFPHQLEEAIELVTSFPKQKFILDHCAKPYIKDKKITVWKKHIEKLASFKNVACKVSGLATEADWSTWKKETIQPYLNVVFDSFGTKRTLFGSDWPVSLLAGDYTKTVGLIENYILQFSKIEQQQIMGLNAKDWYSLNN